MKESKIESWLVKQISELGGIADKFTSPGNPGVADRIVIMPGGKIFFVELKTEIGRMSNIQKWQRERYSKRRADVRLIKGMGQARAFVEELKNEIHATQLSEDGD